MKCLTASALLAKGVLDSTCSKALRNPAKVSAAPPLRTRQASSPNVPSRTPNS